MPDPELVAKQPEREAPEKFIAAARSETGDLAVVYIPVGGKVTLNTEKLKLLARAEWFDPASGARASAGEAQEWGQQVFDGQAAADRVLVLRALMQ